MTREREGVRSLAGGPAEIVLVCRKCSKKLGGGFGRDGGERLAKVLRRVLGAERGIRARKGRPSGTAVIETGCLGLCPKGSVVVLRSGDPPGLYLVPRGAEAAGIAAALAPGG